MIQHIRDRHRLHVRNLLEVGKIHARYPLRNGVPEVSLVAIQSLALLIDRLEVTSLCLRIRGDLRQRPKNLIQPGLPRLKALHQSDAGPDAEQTTNLPSRPDQLCFIQHLLDGVVRSNAAINEGGLRLLEGDGFEEQWCRRRRPDRLPDFAFVVDVADGVDLVRADPFGVYGKGADGAGKPRLSPI